MARQCWDESRHCEISIKLGEHMGSEIGEYGESTFLYAAACNPDPVLRLTGVNRALEGLCDRRVQLDEGVRRVVERPILTFCEDWMLADEVTHVKMGSDWLRRLTEKDPGAARAGARVPAHGRQDLQPRRFPRRERREPDPARAPIPRARRLQQRRERRARRDRASGSGRGGSDGAGGAGRGLSMGRVRVTPDPFTVVPYEVPVIAGLRRRGRGAGRISTRRRDRPGDRRGSAASARRYRVRRHRRPRAAVGLGRKPRGHPP